MQEIPKSTLQICAHIWKKLCHESQVPKFSYEKEQYNGLIWANNNNNVQ